MEGIISLWLEDTLIRQRIFQSVKERRKIIDMCSRLYGDKYSQMHYIVYLEMTDTLLTNLNGTNVNFGGKHGNRGNGFHQKKRIHEPIEEKKPFERPKSVYTNLPTYNYDK